MVYDVFRLARLIRRQRAYALFVSDFLFCIVSSVCMMILFFNLSYGRMRGYAFLFTIVGFLVWRASVSRLFISFMRSVVAAVNGLLNSAKMRIGLAIKKQMRRIYTANYCKRNIKVKKRKEKENDGKEADSR